ncbi:MAG: NYN domain-containing protein [Thermodesulfovibrio sp.]|nr:NYN domain-containing protein [Thermodesulfovibrio sp.]
MSKILIDGYNLIGVLHKNMKKARDKLIENLIIYSKEKRHEITLVFDGYKEGPGKETSEIKGGIRIIYSGAGEKADDVISRILKTEKYSWIVITSDRDIEKTAWKENCVVIDSSIFSDILMGEKFFIEKQKGLTLSRKEKAIIKTIEKL